MYGDLTRWELWIRPMWATEHVYQGRFGTKRAAIFYAGFEWPGCDCELRPCVG